MGDVCYEVATALASFVVAFSMAVPGMIGTELRRAAVGFIGIRMPRMPRMPEAGLATLTAAGTGFAAVANHLYGNGAWINDRIRDQIFPPPGNLTRDREQVHEKRKEKFITTVADWFEKICKGTGDAAYLVMHAVWTFVEKNYTFWIGLLSWFATLADSFRKKMSGERVAVAETALKKKARNKSPGPARKSTRTPK